MKPEKKRMVAEGIEDTQSIKETLFGEIPEPMRALIARLSEDRKRNHEASPTFHLKMSWKCAEASTPNC